MTEPRLPPGAMAADPFDLTRFLQTQEGVLDDVRCELGAGLKRTHWMWFVFPQLRGLGRSPTALRYGLSGLEEARAFAAHPVLGPRLLEWTRLVLAHRGRTAHAIFGSPDDLKFRSSMTLFARAAADGAPFAAALDSFFDGAADPATVALLKA